MIEKHTKFNKLELKELDESKGIVSFYYGIFNNVDLNKDILTPYALKKTISENKSHIYHNRDHCDAVGAPITFDQDSKGAYVTSQLALKTIDGADCMEQYKAGLVKGHSMEFMTIKSSYDETQEVRTLLEIQLWGVTTVTKIPANLLTDTISLKSYEDVTEKISEIERFLRTANVSDKKGNEMLLQLKSLNELALSLEAKAVIDTLPPVKPITIDYNYLSQNLKQK